MAKNKILSRKEAGSIWQMVKENRAKLNGCNQHTFDPAQYDRLGAKLTCLKCGGVMPATDVGEYVRGFRAAGGDPDLVWPGFFDKGVDTGKSTH